MFDYPQTQHVSVSLKVLIKCHQLFILVDCCYVVVMLGLLHNTYLKGADCTGEKNLGVESNTSRLCLSMTCIGVL